MLIISGQNDHFAAMDVAVDNRVVFGYGTDINFIAPDKDTIVAGNCRVVVSARF
jgi:hypothetical protein